MRPFKALLTVTAAAAVIATGITVWSGSATAETETIRIGDINSYTRLPAHTVPYRQGAILAIEEVNRSGGVLGASSSSYRTTIRGNRARRSRWPSGSSPATRWP